MVSELGYNEPTMRRLGRKIWGFSLCIVDISRGFIKGGIL